MITFYRKALKRLTSNRGELIAETIISFMILSILVTAVFLVLSRAMSMTTDSARKAKISQEGEMNPAILMAFPNSEPANIVFNVTGLGIVTHPIIFNTSHAIADAACIKCADFPNCPGVPCPAPDCCWCNDAVAFAPFSVP
ncbi:MAG: hypothetical protein LBC86_09255 [Oscillospiraceae bacterium]|jgi:hypothetical protein|nr:hypothetical protein [Oscillospiraceae bacterium]